MSHTVYYAFFFFLQTNLQTHVSTPDVVSSFQTQINPSSPPRTFTSLNHNPNSKPNHIESSEITRRGDQSPKNGAETVAKPLQLRPDLSQVGGNPTVTYPVFSLILTKVLLGLYTICDQGLSLG